LGSFRITPFLNDHSAFDAYSFLVEAEGRTLFYTGDFRAHGRKAPLFQQLLNSGPKKMNVLLTEGTTITRVDDKGAKSERDLEKEIARSLGETQGIALAYFSAQNIDRFVTFFKASKETGRTFVVDVYLAHILDALERKSLPSPRSDNLLVFLPKTMRQMIKATQSFELVNPYYSRRIYPEALATEGSHLTVLFRPSMRYELERADCLKGAKLLYSLWPGYLEGGGFDLRSWCASHGVTFEIHHTSGHVAVEDLKLLVAALQPERVVPIHTFARERFPDLFSNVQLVDDGEWWDV
jgi:ribonuclease J